jgi:hypothetical protein
MFTWFVEWKVKVCISASTFSPNPDCLLDSANPAVDDDYCHGGPVRFCVGFDELCDASCKAPKKVVFDADCDDEARNAVGYFQRLCVLHSY